MWRIPGLNWIYSVPTSLEGFDGALVLGGLAAPAGHARLEWQVIDETSEVLREGLLLESDTPQPATRVRYVPTDGSVAHLRLQLEVHRLSVAELSDVQILKIRSPYPRAAAHDAAQP